MPNEHVHTRLRGIQAQLMAAHVANSSMSANSRGRERETFISDFLAAVLPPSYRFGSGDATDLTGKRSGQLDVVVEHPIGPSLPAVGSAATRLYLAETVAAVIEVKSNLTNQWDEVIHTINALAPLRRDYPSMMTMGLKPTSHIPLIAVGYKGWKTFDTIKERIKDHPAIAGILVIDEGFFVSSNYYYGITAPGAWALWGMISVLHLITNGLQSASTNPLGYAMDE